MLPGLADSIFVAGEKAVIRRVGKPPVVVKGKVVKSESKGGLVF
jgi:hypothetical protein